MSAADNDQLPWVVLFNTWRRLISVIQQYSSYIPQIDSIKLMNWDLSLHALKIIATRKLKYPSALLAFLLIAFFYDVS